MKSWTQWGLAAIVIFLFAASVLAQTPTPEVVPNKAAKKPVSDADHDGEFRRLTKREIIDALSDLIKEPEARELPNLLDYADRTETIQRDGKQYRVWNRAISAALDEGAGVLIPASEEPYYIDRPIVMASGDYIRAQPEARICAIPGMKTCMVRNQHIVSGRAAPLDATAEPDVDLTITGGVWSQESMDRSETNGVSDAENPVPGTAGILLFSNVRRVSITHLKIEKGAPFAVHLSNAADIFVSDVTVETNCDGIHLNGPLTRAVVEKIVCQRTGDDCIALNAWDWPWSAPTCGPMSMILVQNCRTFGEALKDIRLLAGVLIYPDGSTLDCPIQNVVLRNLDGFNYFKLYAQAPLEMAESCRVGTLDHVYFDTILTPLTGTIRASWTEGYYGGTEQSCGGAAPFSILANSGFLSFENLTIATAPNADGTPCIFHVGPESANTNDPQMPLDIFMSDAHAALGAIALANIMDASGQPYPNPENLVKAVRLSVNPDFPRTRPRGGVGYGTVERVTAEGVEKTKCRQ